MGQGKNRSGLPRCNGGDETVFLSGKTYNQLLDRLEELEGIFNPEDFIATQGKDGKQVRLRTKPAVAGSTGPFCKVFQEDGLWKLLGGTVTGGTGNQTAADIPVGTIGSEALQDGQHYWVKADVTAVTEDGVLLPGANLTSATVGNGTSLPANDIPTAAAPTGTLYISLGSWSGDIFNPAGCGNIQISHCPGNLSYARA